MHLCEADASICLSPIPSAIVMLSKRSRGYDPAGLPGGKRLRSNIADLFLHNTVSAERAHSLYEDAADAGIADVRDLGKRTSGKNASRTLLARLMRRWAWPPLFFCQGAHLEPTEGSGGHGRIAVPLAT